MGIKRVVDTAFWTDGKVDEFSPEDKYFMLYLLTNPFTTQLGIYEMSIKQAAFQLGYSVETVKVLLDRFENEYNMIVFSPKTSEIAVLNFLRHSIIKGGKPVEDCLKREIVNVKNAELLYRVFDHIESKGVINDTVAKVISDFRNANEKENDNANENDNENDNDNDNDVSLPYRQRIVDESSKDTFESIKTTVLQQKGEGEKICEWCGCSTTILHKHHFPIPKRLGGTDVVSICSNCHSEFHSQEKKVLGDSHTGLIKPRDPKKPFGKFNNVLLTDEEYLDFQARHTDWQERIEKMSAYMQANNKQYKDHFATLELWAMKDKEKQKETAQPKSNNPFANALKGVI